MDHKLPKKIWFLWLQGLESAPMVVKRCYASWAKCNPEWEIILLDEKNLADYYILKPGALTNQAISDIVRVNLLAKFGGIWVDATCFCTRPVDDWLPYYMTRGFFAFDKPGDDRMLSSWFIACHQKNYIIETYQAAVNAYWEKNPKIKSFESSPWLFLTRRLQRQGTQIWFKPFVTKILRVYPYLWFHYLFESIYFKDSKIREMWNTTPKISADVPRNLQFAGLLNPIRSRVKEDIDNKVSPVYKLTWKFDEAAYKPGTILEYLLNN